MSDPTSQALKRCLDFGFRLTISSTADHSGPPGTWRDGAKVYIVSGYKGPRGELVVARGAVFHETMKKWIDKAHVIACCVGER